MTGEPSELPPPLHAAITKLCAAGDELGATGRFTDAIALYNEALAMVPEPKGRWDASTWILGSIADACFLSDDKATALDALRYAMTCPDALGNPFLHLRFGQVLVDLGEPDAAADELTRAYMGAGVEIFAGEDGRYLDFLKSRITL